MKKTKSRAAIIGLGILVAFASLCSYSTFFSSSDISKHAKTEQQDQEPSDEVFFSAPSTSLPSPVHVTLQPTVFFLFEIVFEKVGKILADSNHAIPSGQFFRMIFGLVISPNAP